MRLPDTKLRFIILVSIIILYRILSVIRILRGFVMAERYQDLFRIQSNLYKESSPVIIEAGALTTESD